MKLNELENVLLDQIEKLNDDSIAENDPEQVKNMIEKSKAISSLASNIMEINNFKLEAVKEFGNNGDMYAGYLGLEDKKSAKV